MISLPKYQLGFNTIVSNLLAWFYRFTWLVEYIQAMIAPLQTINDDFYQTIVSIDDYLGYSGQHKILETLLNDKFDTTNRAIYLTENNSNGTQIDIYKQTETNPELVDIYKETEIDSSPITVYKQSEGSVTLYDFTVNVPVALVYDAAKFNGYIQRYVQTKTYNIVTF